MHQGVPFECRIYCDEAGRGPLAGPVTVGCFLSLEKIDLSECKDSKQLKPGKRQVLYATLQKHALNKKVCINTGRATAQEIDKYGIIPAIRRATLRGVGALLKDFYVTIWRDRLLASDLGEDILAVTYLDRWIQEKRISATLLKKISTLPQSKVKFCGLIRDGNHTFGLDTTLGRTVTTIIKGDQKNPFLSAASIVAKVQRDAWMEKIDRYFPDYQFKKHKGYGTAEHRKLLSIHGSSILHRSSFCRNIVTKSSINRRKTTKRGAPISDNTLPMKGTKGKTSRKPNLVVHICCAPDLSRPLHRLKEHFKLYLFWYNPNIHPRKEHEHRYAQFLKLIGLEKGDYEILEDRYDPKEFFDAMMEQRVTIDSNLQYASRKQVLQKAGEMEEWSDRCNPCYAMRLEAAAKIAKEHHITYFTSTLLISPKKKMEKLYRRGKEAESLYPETKFLRFDFAKNDGYHHAVNLTKQYGLRRQRYCGCGRTIPKKGEQIHNYQGG